AILCCNVVHIAPWRGAQGLFAGAAPRLAPGGRLFLYGPFMRDGRHTAESNARFAVSLRGANPQLGGGGIPGVAALAAGAELSARAEGAKLALADGVDMPANNRILSFEPGR